MALRHVLFTRFNVASPGKEAEIRLRPGWLDVRFELFERYCLPSVAAQSRRDFEWIIFFDEKTPSPYLDRIEALRAVFPFRPHYTALFWLGDMTPDLAGDGRADWILTTRLDSDDLLAVDFMQRLREETEVPSPQVVNFDNGVILAPTAPVPALYARRDTSNPFSSLLERADGPIRTIYGVTHREIGQFGRINAIQGAPAWMQVVHGGNVSNEIRGRRISVRTVDRLFPHMALGAQAAQEPPLALAVDNIVQRPVRTARRLGRRVLARLGVR
ncbi:glycosyltransferase [Aureimonas jatrophae]|uniref:Putative rhamnosyl transferase n=1 Tax=Aureimonas jatrophae TaxID=1166073 RepID=A0A1H0NCU6_9HYPH|nr:glycosyltransferase [Aureimonas jatrophae]MBB3951175.1 hypothetical protein [Aureimonas jatrophae]SDO90507.1 Putative rhamnosyl transferase [Aureimonas jatrophae]